MSICKDCICRKYCGDDDIRRCERYFRDGGIKKEQTNEEWLKSMNTEQFAEALAWIEDRSELPTVRKENVKAFEEWLKQPHTTTKE